MLFHGSGCKRLYVCIYTHMHRHLYTSINVMEWNCICRQGDSHPVSSVFLSLMLLWTASAVSSGLPWSKECPLESPAPSELSRQLAVARGQALLCVQYSGMQPQPELCSTASFLFCLLFHLKQILKIFQTFCCFILKDLVLCKLNSCSQMYTPSACYFNLPAHVL